MKIKILNVKKFITMEVYTVIYHILGTSFKKIVLKQPSLTMNLNSIRLYITLASQKIQTPNAIDIVWVKVSTFLIIIPTNCDMVGAELCLENHCFRPWDSSLNGKTIMRCRKTYWFEIMSPWLLFWDINLKVIISKY